MQPRERTDDRLLTGYLLGTLPEEEQRRVEEAYFRDEALFHELLEVAEKLAAARNRGELSRSERVSFERRVLACREWRGRLQATKRLEQLASRAPGVPSGVTAALPATSRPFRLRWALATLGAAALLAALGSQWIRFRMPAVAPQEARPGAAPSTRPNTGADTSREAAVLPRRTLDLTLRATAFRDGGRVPVLRLERTVARVRLRLPFQRRDQEGYEAVLRTAEGSDVLTVPVERDPTSESGLVMEVPAERLAPGDYILTLKARAAGRDLREVADYYFSVAVP